MSTYILNFAFQSKFFLGLSRFTKSKHNKSTRNIARLKPIFFYIVVILEAIKKWPLLVNIYILSLSQSEFLVGHNVDAIHVAVGVVLPHVRPDLTALPGPRVGTVRALEPLGHAALVLNVSEHVTSILVGLRALGTSVAFFAISALRTRRLPNVAPVIRVS